jgi:hypothetical protein
MNSTRNIPLIVIRVVVWVFLIGAAYISTSHIVHVSQTLGLRDWQAYTVPGFIDGIAIVGKVSMLPRFSDAFRRSGFKLLMFGGVLSLAANVAAGSNWGERGFGVLVVAGFMLLESHATKADRTAIAPPTVPAGRKLDPAEAKRRAAKARETRERNKLAKLTPAEKRQRTLAAKAVAPFSPGAPVTGYVPTPAQVAQMTA